MYACFLDDRFELLRPENIDQHQLEKYARVSRIIDIIKAK